MTREDQIKTIKINVKLAIKSGDYRQIQMAKIFAKQNNIEFKTNKDKTIIEGEAFDHNGKFDYLF